MRPKLLDPNLLLSWQSGRSLFDAKPSSAALRKDLTPAPNMSGGDLAGENRQTPTMSQSKTLFLGISSAGAFCCDVAFDSTSQSASIINQVSKFPNLRTWSTRKLPKLLLFAARCWNVPVHGSRSRPLRAIHRGLGCEWTSGERSGTRRFNKHQGIANQKGDASPNTKILGNYENPHIITHQFYQVVLYRSATNETGA